MKKKLKLSILGLILTSNIGILSTSYANNTPANTPVVLTESEKKKLEEKRKAEAKKKAEELAKKLNTTNLNLITVKDIIIRVEPTNEIIKGYSILKEQMVSDIQDIIRYENDVTLEQDQRFGSTGFNIRGVTDNRVAINIDGVAQAESVSSNAYMFIVKVNDYNNVRNGIETETIGKVKISKGADSINSGSGALGGSVNYETKKPQDYLTKNKKYYGSIKGGYNTSNSQQYISLTGAANYNKLDFLVLFTSRNGKEITNFSEKTTVTDSAAINKADNKSLSILFKSSFNIDQENKIGYSYDYLNQVNITPIEAFKQDDSSLRQSHSFSFESKQSNPLWDSLKVKYSTQHINSIGGNEVKCQENCYELKDRYDGDRKTYITNTGIGWKNGNIVNAYGDSNFKFEENPNLSKKAYYIYTDEKRKPGGKLKHFERKFSTGSGLDDFQNKYPHKASRKQYWYDCSQWDCKNITVYKETAKIIIGQTVL